MILKVICLLLLLAVKLSAQEMMTLNKAIELAFEQNPQIQIARNNAEIAEKNAFFGQADLLPRINFTTGAFYQDAGQISGIPGAITTTQAQLSASYTLFDGFGNIYRLRSLQAGKTLGEKEAQMLIEQTLMHVSNAYYAVASAWENLQIAEELIEISQERLLRAENSAAYGRARTIDVLSARVDLIADSVTVAQAYLFWDRARNQFNSLLFRDLKTPFMIDTTVTFSAGIDFRRLLASANDHNTDIQASQTRLEQARYNLGSATASHMPRLDLTASYSFSQTEPNTIVRLDDPVKTARIGASISFNLFNGLRSHIQRQNAAITLNSRELAYEQKMLEIEQILTDTWAAYQNSLLILQLAGRRVEAARLNFQRISELFALGQITTTQFREAQLNLIRAKTNFSAAKYDAKLDEIELLKLSGGLINTFINT